jgi:Flp pilus assembly pilin Flp
METLRNCVLQGFVLAHESESGQGYVEYILIIAFVGLAVIGALKAFSGQISDAFNTIGGGL